MSLSDFYEDHPKYRTRLVLHVRDSMEDAVQASAAALDLIKNEKVSAIIGPTSSMQAEFMIRLAKKSQVPTITFSATSPLLTSINSQYFVRATLNDVSQVRAIAAIVKSFEWRRVIAIYVDNESGEGMMPYLIIALQDVQASVVYKSVISLEANDDQIEKELYKLMTMQTRVFVLHMPPNLGFRVIQKARDIKMMEEGYVWLLTDEMTNWIGSNERGSSLENIQGLLGVRSYIPQSKELEHFRLRGKKKFEKDHAKPNVFALWAYDSITALAMAVEKISIKTLEYDNGRVSSKDMTDMVTLGVSRHGPSLLKALSDVRFKGLAGEFKLINRELESSTFEIINYIGNKERIIGLVDSKSEKTTAFRQVTWPGNSTVVPKGWEISTNGKKLIVGVPVKRGFFDFVSVNTKKSITNGETTPTGYSIDVFEAALKKLPYSVIPKYVHFKSPKNYDDLVNQVHNGRWDAVAGDVTIRLNRSLYVDFTLPYTESGVFMLVPMKDKENKNTWVFLEPWGIDLWVTTGCFFVFIGFVVWLLEHRVNDDFRGPPHHQIGTSFWFSFSTLNFAHREKVVSNLARFVVVVWCFVVLVLTQSYTANLTSFLIKRLQATSTTVEDLIRNGDTVGYQRGSFVHELLKNQGFQESKLKAYDSSEECHMLMSNRTVSAAFDEVAYFKVVLSQFCSKYAMVEPSFKSAGFGFVFPKNSPLTSDVSKAILSLSEGNEMKNIEKNWLVRQSPCPDPSTDLSHNRLGLSSFWGLFLIAGLASFLALVLFLANFLYEQRHTLFEDSGIPFLRKLMFLLRIFNEKDRKSHMFKESAVHNRSSPPSTQCTPRPSVEIIPWPRSPSQSQIRESEPRRVSLDQSEDLFTPTTGTR
ncbi:unnamed protein product [Microthlaspi erraticum]|uniref:Glutamate receptor n=1 Tax=Microthlaspi erraticum TaxID=1685480 RepID=A0A6D2HUE4_9BRAS|nr:unnamed protein product [Microthlaspi erraticum]